MTTTSSAPEIDITLDSAPPTILSTPRDMAEIALTEISNRCSDSESSTASPVSAGPSTHSSTPSVCGSENENDNFNHKPSLPYALGTDLNVTVHTPPAPFGYGYTTSYPEVREDWENLTQLELCISHTPENSRSPIREKRVLTITAIIRTGYNRGVQLVIVNDDMVAKIYDPLYYQFFDDYDNKNNVLHDAHGDYSREVAAYLELQNSPAVLEVIPTYHGSYTIEVETPIESFGRMGSALRRVPLILIERLRGKTMADIHPDTLSLDIKSAILKKAVHAESILAHADIVHHDFCPRNIILVNPDRVEPNVDRPVEIGLNTIVKIIDFNVSEVRTHPDHKHQKYLKSQGKVHISHPKLPSPIVEHKSLYYEFHHWMPSGADGEVEKWLWQQFHSDSRYRPVVWDPLNPEVWAEYADEIEDSRRSLDSAIGINVGAHEEIYGDE